MSEHLTICYATNQRPVQEGLHVARIRDGRLEVLVDRKPERWVEVVLRVQPVGEKRKEGLG